MTAVLPSLLLLNTYNDGYIVGIGGSATTDIETKVQMVDEDIHISAPSGKVSVSFTFKNHGDEAIIPMAFPEEGYNAGEAGEEASKGFKYFRAYVDGVKTETTRKHFEDPYEGAYKYWWVKQVPFKAGQTRKVRNEYQTPGGWNVMQYRSILYTLSTGATWNKNIQRANATVDLSAFPKGTVIHARPEGFKVKGKTLTWQWNDFKPTETSQVVIYWLPKDKETKELLQAFKEEFLMCLRTK
jgi:hypothetical protein